MTDAGAGSELNAVIDEQIACAESMLRTLEIESEALLAGDAEKLNDVSAGKAQLADALDRLESERRGLAEALKLARATLDDAATRDRWDRLLGLLEQCRDRNARNGSLVQARRTQIEVALRALTAGQPNSYDAAGNRLAATPTHNLGSA